MSLQRLLRLLPLGLAALVALEMAMMVVQDGLSRASFEQTRIAQLQRDALGRVRTNCDAVTFKAVAWTLTRRNTQGRQYQEGKAACFDAVAQAKRLLSAEQEKDYFMHARVGPYPRGVDGILVWVTVPDT